MMTPARVNSKMPNVPYPAWSRRALPSRFVDVPMSVQVPPSMEAKARGISSLDALTFGVRFYYEIVKRVAGK